MSSIEEKDRLEMEEQLVVRDSDEKKITTERLIEGMKQKYNFFTDQATSERFLIRPDGVCEEFADNIKMYISRYYYALTGKKTSDVEFTKSLLEWECTNNKQTTHLRRAAMKENNERVLYYRISPQEHVRITSTGWDMVSPLDSKILFRDSDLNCNQVMPEKGDKSLYELLSYLPLSDNQRILIMGVLVSSFIEDIDHALVNISGDQGSGKTECACHVATAIDPGFDGIGDLAIEPPKKSDKMGMQMAGQAAIVYDNIQNFSQSQSDTVAVGATGGSIITRELYTTKHMIRLPLNLTIFLTGITSALYNPDVIDRSINIPLDRIDEYVSKREFREMGNSLMPFIIHEIFDILSVTIEKKTEYINPSNHRLSDFVTVMHQAARYCGIDDEKVLLALEENGRIGNETILESTPIARVIAGMVYPGETKELTTSQIYNYAITNNIGTYKSVESAGKALKKIKLNLIKEGFLISDRDVNTKKYTITNNVQKRIEPKIED